MLAQLRLSYMVRQLLQLIGIISIMTFNGHCYSTSALGDCRYRLNEQPSNTMTCNPHLSGKLTTRCAVQFSTTEGGPLRLAWYSRAQVGGTAQRIFSGFVTKNTASSVESELTIQIRDTVTLCDGFSAYYCQVSFYNGTLLSKSQEIYLFPRYVFSNALKMCEEQDVQSTYAAECVDPRFSIAEQTTTSPSLPVTTSSLTVTTSANPPSEVTTLPPTSMTPLTNTTLTVNNTETFTERSSPTTEDVPATENVSTIPPPATNSQPMVTTSLPMITEPSTVTTESQPATASEVSPSTMLNEAPSEASVATTGSQVTSMDPPSPQSPLPQAPSPESEVGSGGGFDDAALIFLTLGAAVFLLILISCILFCLCIWSDSCRQCGYEICCSDESCCTCSCCLCLEDI